MPSVKNKVQANKVKNHWSQEKKIQNITKNLVGLGLTQEDVASVLGIPSRTLREARKRTPELQAAVDDGKSQLHNLLLAQMVLAATGYDYEETRTEREASGKVKKFITFQKRMPPNAQLYQFLMSNRWPDTWKIRKEFIQKRFEARATIALEAKDIDKLAGKLLGSNVSLQGGDVNRHSDIVSGDNSELDTREHRVPQEVGQVTS